MECRQAVMDFPWMDDESHIKGNIEAWRASFPCARAVNVSGRGDIVDADFVHIQRDVRLQTVKMRGCGVLVQVLAFVHLREIHTLNMSGCRQATNTDAAFMHLRGIHTLNIEDCNQMNITTKLPSNICVESTQLT